MRKIELTETGAPIKVMTWEEAAFVKSTEGSGGSMSKGTLRLLKKLARRANAMAGWIWLCVDCAYVAKRVHEEKWARHMAIRHVNNSGHTVRMIGLK